MSKSSSALVLVSPSGVGSFHSRLWRINPRQGQLVEGSSNGPYFLYGGSEDEAAFFVDGLESNAVLAATVLLTTMLVNEQVTMDYLRSMGNLVQSERGERVPPGWDLEHEAQQMLATHLSPIARVGIVRLEECSVLSGEVVEGLLRLGFDVTTFEPTHLGAQCPA